MEVSDISSADKLYKILAKDPRDGNGPLLLPYENIYSQNRKF
jgi:hypothetical protein